MIIILLYCPKWVGIRRALVLVLPAQTALRVWDWMMLDGPPPRTTRQPRTAAGKHYHALPRTATGFRVFKVSAAAGGGVILY